MNEQSLSRTPFSVVPVGNQEQFRLSPWHADAVCAFGELLKSHEYARDTGSDIWNFAVEIKTLKQFGFTETDLRWLVIKKLVEHRWEASSPDEAGRRFQTAGSLRFHRHSCFVLTPTGVEYARRLLQGTTNDCGILPLKSVTLTAPDAPPPPHWDASRRTLTVCGYLVKHFRWPAPNQELVLTAFQEEGWALEIADPLSPMDGLPTKERLHDTIKGLNRHQKMRLIQFGGDGTGEGVVWRFTPLAYRTLGRDLTSQ